MLPETFTPALLRQLELLRLQARRAFLGTRQGGHVSVKRGHGIEFSDYRQYQPGDNPRHIDWGVFGRSDRLYVKRFQEDQSLSILILLDASRSMATPAGQGKWESARDIALALAYVGLMNQDPVTIVPLGAGRPIKVHGARSVHTLGKELLALKPSGPAELSPEVKRALSLVRFPGIAIFISDFLAPLPEVMEEFQALRAKNFEITAIQVLGPDDINPLAGETEARAIDSETGQEMLLSTDGNFKDDYGYLLVTHNDSLADFFRDSGIHYALAFAPQDLSSFLALNLSKTGLLG